MKFRSEYIFRDPLPLIDHGHRLYAIGSCFSEHIVHRLQMAGFNTRANSHGIVYNPISLAKGLEDLLTGKRYTAADLYEHQGRWISFGHHGRFAHTDPRQCLEEINQRLEAHSIWLAGTSHLFITLGTAWAYRRKDTGEVVANCHKLPGTFFEKILLYPSEIKEIWTPVLGMLKKMNPSCHIIYTVSPVKHLRDGIHENQLGKAALLLAIHQLQQLHPEVHYFPAYELVTDDLRDYRFYEKDFAHPNTLATDYVWERMKEVFFGLETREAAAAAEAFRQLQNHRPANGAAHAQALRQAREALANKYPYLSLATIADTNS